MGILAWIFFEALLWILFFCAWIILLPFGLLFATPVLLIVSATQRKPVKQLFCRFIQWWMDILPSTPEFNRSKRISKR
jgi:hypothetical protein